VCAWAQRSGFGRARQGAAFQGAAFQAGKINSGHCNCAFRRVRNSAVANVLGVIIAENLAASRTEHFCGGFLDRLADAKCERQVAPRPALASSPPEPAWLAQSASRRSAVGQDGTPGEGDRAGARSRWSTPSGRWRGDSAMRSAICAKQLPGARHARPWRENCSVLRLGPNMLLHSRGFIQPARRASSRNDPTRRHRSIGWHAGFHSVFRRGSYGPIRHPEDRQLCTVRSFERVPKLTDPSKAQPFLMAALQETGREEEAERALLGLVKATEQEGAVKACGIASAGDLARAPTSLFPSDPSVFTPSATTLPEV
jgi:hypothetical protein